MRRKKYIVSMVFGISLAAGGLGCLLAGQAAAAPSRAESEPDAGPPAAFPRYDLSLTLDYGRHTVTAHERVSVVNRSLKDWDRLVFCVTPAVRPGAFLLDRLSVTIDNRDQAVKPRFLSSMLILDLPRFAKPGAEVAVEMSYRLVLRRLDPYDIHPAGNLGYGSQVLQCGDCFPTLTPYEPGRGFREWEYAPIGDPYLYPLADFDVRLRAEAGVVVAAAGLAEEKAGDWRFTLRNARSFAFLASPRYTVLRSEEKDGVPIAVYYVQGRERAGQVMLAAAARCLQLYTSLYGPYPYPSLVVAQNAYASGMEYSGMVTISNLYIKEYTDEKPELLLFITAHEISHQWWYGAVGNDQVLEPWLDEGLAKYSEFLFFREYYPALMEWWRSNIKARHPAGRFIDDTVYDFKSAPRDYSRVIYGLAPAFIQELHQLIGETAFTAFLKDYFRHGQGRWVTAADFFTVLGRHTEEDITPLLQKYFRNPPRLLPVP